MHVKLKAPVVDKARRLVIKLGSSVVTTGSGLQRDNIGRLVAEMSALCEQGYEVIVVSSGARAAGLPALKMTEIPSRIPEQQAAAAVGQISLMALYEEFFSDFGRHVGQVLLTAADIGDRTRYLNARHTMEHLLAHGVVPVVNENDSVAIDELKFGDNDRLSALVAGLMDADLLIILSDVDGVFDEDPRLGESRLREVVENIDDTIGRCGGLPGQLGTGGMTSKLKAAASASHRGIATVVASGLNAGVLGRVLDPNTPEGSFIPAADNPISGRKHWIAYSLPLRGRLGLDAGAVRAVASRGSSLLPAGIKSVDGQFSAGDCVSCLDPDGVEVARGLIAYDADDCRRISGMSSGQIEATLGYHISDEVIHRDDMVVLNPSTREDS